METNILKATIIRRDIIMQGCSTYVASLDINSDIKTEVNDILRLEESLVHSIDEYIRNHSNMEVPAILTGYQKIEFKLNDSTVRSTLHMIKYHIDTLNSLNKVVTDTPSPTLIIKTSGADITISPNIEELTDILEKEYQRRLNSINQLKRFVIDPINRYQYTVEEINSKFEELYKSEFDKIDESWRMVEQ